MKQWVYAALQRGGNGPEVRREHRYLPKLPDLYEYLNAVAELQGCH